MAINQSPTEIARLGEDLYNEKIKPILEPSNNGKFLAIEIETRQYFLGETAEEALLEAKKQFPDKVFHLVRVGYSGAFAHSRLSQRKSPYARFF